MSSYIMEEGVIQHPPCIPWDPSSGYTEPKGPATTLSKNFHEKERFVLGVDLYGPQQPW
jgi:hypothetical protein